ncbi:unnamed protein product [Parajaminaea phylloscopi]
MAAYGWALGADDDQVLASTRPFSLDDDVPCTASPGQYQLTDTSAPPSPSPLAMFRTANAASALPSPSGPSIRRGHGAAASPGGIDRHPTGSSRAGAPRRYPHRLNFYNRPPTMEVTIEQFESWAIDRLKVLAEIESRQSRNNSYKELKEAVLKKMDQHLPLSATTAARSGAGIDVDMERMKDHISHFVLRLAFCRSEDLQRRFVRTETVLFRLRFESDDTSERDHFLRTLDLDWQMVTKEEKAQHKEELLAATPSLSAHKWDAENFFKVPWTKVPDLVEKRRVFLRGGTAWVPMSEQASLVLAEFSNRLLKELEFTARSLPRLDEDDRLLPLLNHLSLGFLAGLSSDFTNSSTALIGEDGQAVEVRAEMISALVKKHAPMCMRMLNQNLEERKHLKHQGRLQFGLFLKEIGLGVDQAMLFWRRAFAGMTDDKFNKEYRYNIRYNYGLEGKRVDYPARSCARIIMQDTPGAQDTHGCPFRHHSTANLSAALSANYRLSAQQNSEILSTVKAGHYHVACTRLFEITHGAAKGKGLDGRGESVAHPNRYFERSWKMEQEEGGADGAKKEEEDDDDDGKDGNVDRRGVAGPSSRRSVKSEEDTEMLWTKSTLESDVRDKRSSIFIQPSSDAVRNPKNRSTPDSGIELAPGHGGGGGGDVDVDDEFGDMGDFDVDFDALDRAAQEQADAAASSSSSPGSATPQAAAAAEAEAEAAGQSQGSLSATGDEQTQSQSQSQSPSQPQESMASRPAGTADMDIDS